MAYVTCSSCKSGNTLLTKDNRITYITCESCKSVKSVKAINSGFQAVSLLLLLLPLVPFGSVRWRLSADLCLGWDDSKPGSEGLCARRLRVVESGEWMAAICWLGTQAFLLVPVVTSSNKRNLHFLSSFFRSILPSFVHSDSNQTKLETSNPLLIISQKYCLALIGTQCPPNPPFEKASNSFRRASSAGSGLRILSFLCCRCSSVRRAANLYSERKRSVQKLQHCKKGRRGTNKLKGVSSA